MLLTFDFYFALKLYLVSKLQLLIWKNYLLITRNKWKSLFELLAPFVYVASVLFVKSQIGVTYFADNTEFPKFNVNYIPEFEFEMLPNKAVESSVGLQLVMDMFVPKWVIMYAPNTDRVNTIMEKLRDEIINYKSEGFHSISRKH